MLLRGLSAILRSQDKREYKGDLGMNEGPIPVFVPNHHSSLYYTLVMSEGQQSIKNEATGKGVS